MKQNDSARVFYSIDSDYDNDAAYKAALGQYKKRLAGVIGASLRVMVSFKKGYVFSIGRKNRPFTLLFKAI